MCSGNGQGQTVSILQLIPFLKGARVLFSREWAGLLVKQFQLCNWSLFSRVQGCFSPGVLFGAWVGGTFFFLKGVNTIFGLGLNWEALLSSDSLGLGVGGMTHVSIAKVPFYQGQHCNLL